MVPERRGVIGNKTKFYDRVPILEKGPKTHRFLEPGNDEDAGWWNGKEL